MPNVDQTTLQEREQNELQREKDVEDMGGIILIFGLCFVIQKNERHVKNVIEVVARQMIFDNQNQKALERLNVLPDLTRGTQLKQEPPPGEEAKATSYEDDIVKNGLYKILKFWCLKNF